MAAPLSGPSPASLLFSWKAPKGLTGDAGDSGDAGPPASGRLTTPALRFTRRPRGAFRSLFTVLCSLGRASAPPPQGRSVLRSPGRHSRPLSFVHLRGSSCPSCQPRRANPPQFPIPPSVARLPRVLFSRGALAPSCPKRHVTREAFPRRRLQAYVWRDQRQGRRGGWLWPWRDRARHSHGHGFARALPARCCHRP